MSIQSAVAIVDELLRSSLQRRATDIHLLPQADGLHVRMRIDGVLYSENIFASCIGQAIIARCKVLAQLDIA